MEPGLRFMHRYYPGPPAVRSKTQIEFEPGHGEHYLAIMKRRAVFTRNDFMRGRCEDFQLSEYFRLDLPLVEGRYSWSEGKYVEVFDSTVRGADYRTDGLSGFGEVCPLGPFYLPAFRSRRTGPV